MPQSSSAITEFDVPEKLKEYGITRLALLGEAQIKAHFNGVPIVATYDPEDITATMKRFRKDAAEVITPNGKDASVIAEELIRVMTALVSGHAEKAVMSGGSVSIADSEQQQRQATVMKYTQDADGFNPRVWEAVRVGGRFYLASYDRMTGKLSLWTNNNDGSNGQEQQQPQEQQQEQWQLTTEENKVLRPYSDKGIEPYSFVDAKEIEQYIQLAKMETAGSLFRKVREWARKFYDTDTEEYINLIAADIVFTYFQDRLGKTHYVFVWGAPDQGKGAILETFNQLAYRPADVTSITGPVLYRIMGSVEKGQVIMIIDEANRLEDDDELLLNVLKVGYKGDQRVPRVVDNDRNIIEWFYAYCFKIIAAEELPSPKKTGGLVSRCLQIKTAPGDPELDIGDIVNNAGDAGNMAIMAQLAKLRKLLFAYRLIHYYEPIPDVKIKGIIGRDKELTKPLIRLFRTHGDSDSLETVKRTMHYFIKCRNEAKTDSLEAAVLRLVKQRLGYENGKNKDNDNSKNNNELAFYDIWEYVKEQLNGKSVVEGEDSDSGDNGDDNDGNSKSKSSKNDTLTTDLFGKITKRRLAAVLHSIGGKKGRDTSGDKRVWLFDNKTLNRFSNIYKHIPDTIELEEQATLDLSPTPPPPLTTPPTAGQEEEESTEGEEKI